MEKETDKEDLEDDVWYEIEGNNGMLAFAAGSFLKALYAHPKFKVLVEQEKEKDNENI